MARVVWTDPGFESLEEVRRYIAQHSPETAVSVVERIVQATRQLETFPSSGRLVPNAGDPNVREIIVLSHRAIYRISGEDVEILLVRHGARLFGDVPGL